jgi:hypothetical protein
MKKEGFDDGTFTDIEVVSNHHDALYSVVFTKGEDLVEQYMTGLNFDAAFLVLGKLDEYFGVKREIQN